MKIDEFLEQTFDESFIKEVHKEYEQARQKAKEEMSDTVTVTIPIKKCNKCPYRTTERTRGAGYALDWHCSKMENKKIAGYVEWDSEVKGIPDWCPFRESEESALQQIRGYITRKREDAIIDIENAKHSKEALLWAKATRTTCSVILDVIADILRVQDED